MYSLRPKMIVLPPQVFCPKIVIQDQMFIYIVDLQNFAKEFGVSKNFYIYKIIKTFDLI